jgi:Flp pilus assembly protein TadG
MRMLRKFLGDDSGSVAVEWALVGPMFLLTLLAIVELGIVVTTQTAMEAATRSAAQLIRTGQVHEAGNTLASFQTLLCSEMSTFLSTTDCQTSLIIDVVSTTGSNVAAISFPPCAVNTSSPPRPGACPFAPGGPGDFVGVQLTYERRFIVPWVGSMLSTAADSQHVKLQSTIVFRNEAF